MYYVCIGYSPKVVVCYNKFNAHNKTYYIHNKCKILRSDLCCIYTCSMYTEFIELNYMCIPL